MRPGRPKENSVMAKKASPKKGQHAPSSRKTVEQKAEPKLTKKREAFIRVYMDLGNQSEAYRQAFPASQKWKPEAVHTAASQLMAIPMIATRVSELSAKVRQM